MQEFHKRFDKEFKHCGTSFEQAVGEARPLNDAVGRIAMNFSELENEISHAISFLLKTSLEKGLLITSEMSFKAKLNVMAAMMKAEYLAGNVPDPRSEADFHDLVYMCQKSEEMRNRLLHSSWVYSRAAGEMQRLKRSAKSKRGYVEEKESLTPGQVLNIADYIIYTAISVDEFFDCEFEGYVRSKMWAQHA